MPIKFSAKQFGKIKDSKKLTPGKREEIFEKLKKIKKEKIIDYFVCYESVKRIDKIGISKAIKNCLEKALTKLKIKPRHQRKQHLG
jgi:ribonuclease HII